MRKIRVLVADSRALLREALIKVLGETMSVDLVSVCRNGEEAIEQAIKLKPDIILLDGGVETFDCIKVSQRVREIQPDIRVIIFTPLMRQYRDPLYFLGAEA